MKPININGREYFFKKIFTPTSTYSVCYLFYILKKEPSVSYVKRKRFIFFGPVIEIELKHDAVYDFVFRTENLKEFSEFPKAEVKKLEKAYMENKIINDRSTIITI